ncbi:MAG TPA: NfeD family protein [Burkholderiales bacterium]|nr:NfeD family protein [Burkholderiales bacterium]
MASETAGSAPRGGSRSRSGRMWRTPVLVRYWAMQLPSTGVVLLLAILLAEDFGWPRWLVFSAVAAWVVKDALVYLIVWPAYDPQYMSPFPYRMEGAVGIVLQRIEETGTVRVWGELWNARLSREARHIDEGEKVRIEACHGFTLIVAPCSDLH